MGVGEHQAGAGKEEEDKFHVAFAASDWRAESEAGEILWRASTGCPFYTFPTSGSEDDPLEIS